MREWIIGRNPIYEVLRAGRRQAFQIQVVEKTKKKDPFLKIKQRSNEIIKQAEDVSRKNKVPFLGVVKVSSNIGKTIITLEHQNFWMND